MIFEVSFDIPIVVARSYFLVPIVVIDVGRLN